MTEYKLFQDTFSIQLPENFSDLDDKAASIMYPAQNRPPIIKTDGVASIAFNRAQADTDIEVMPQIIRMTKMNIKRIQPGIQFFEEGCEKLENIEYGWFDHKGYALDGEIYYLNAFPIVAGKMFHVSFNAPYKTKEEWKLKILEILRTMQDLTRIGKRV